MNISELQHTITIGADPEGVLVKTGVSYKAAGIIKTTRIRAGQVGVDGSGGPIEFRPTFSYSPVVVTRNLQTLIETAAGMWDGEIYVGNGATGMPTGGHIHIGFTTVGVSDNMIKNLCYLFDTVLLPYANMLSDTRLLASRRNIGYGKLSNYRHKIYGFEYRTIPSWLYDPLTALFFIKAAKALTISCLEDGAHQELLNKLSPYQNKDGKETITDIVFLTEIITSLPYMKDTPGSLSVERVLKLINDGVVWDNTNILNNWEYSLPAREPRAIPILRKVNDDDFVELTNDEVFEVYTLLRRAT